MAKNILVIRNDRFGEFLLNIPAIQALKEKYPLAKLSLAVSSAVCELAGVVEKVNEVVVWDEVKRDLRKHKFDLCVILNPGKEAHWAVFRAGIPARVGYDRKWGFLLTRKLKDTKHLGNRHEVDCNLELVGLVGAKTLDKTPKINVDDNLFREFIGQRIVAIHPFTSDPVKEWPVERFKELARRIQGELGLKVIMVGLSEIVLDTGDDIVNLINKTSLVELAALLKRCSLLISCDSGPMHLAAAVGTPVVALFRNDLPGKSAQRWGPVGVHTVIEKGNLEEISVEEVFSKIKERMQI
jgi:ADP-heptose:LPS heptosyltransferase